MLKSVPSEDADSAIACSVGNGEITADNLLTRCDTCCYNVYASCF